jgi:hypothetical protein
VPLLPPVGSLWISENFILRDLMFPHSQKELLPGLAGLQVPEGGDLEGHCLIVRR